MGKSGFKKQTSTLFSLGLVKKIEKDEGSVQPLVSPLGGGYGGSFVSMLDDDE
jgi:hypothetical protein